MPPIYCLSGLPRAGSTVLSAILNQNPRVHVSATSPLYELFKQINHAFNSCDLQHNYDAQRIREKTCKALVDAFYGDEERIVFDKHRRWPRHVDVVKKWINADAKVIITIRPLAEIVTSYCVLCDQDNSNFLDRRLLQQGFIGPTNDDRAKLLWEVYLKGPYEAIKNGLDLWPDNLFFVRYDELVCDAEHTVQRLYDYFDLPEWNHNFDNLSATAPNERDEMWGLRNLHKVRDTLERQSRSPADYLSDEMLSFLRSQDIVAPPTSARTQPLMAR